MFAVIDLVENDIVEVLPAVSPERLASERAVGRDIYPIQALNASGSGLVMSRVIDKSERRVWEKWLAPEVTEDLCSPSLSGVEERVRQIEAVTRPMFPNHATFAYRQTPSNKQFLLGYGSWDANIGLIPKESGLIVGLTGFIEPKPTSGTLDIQVLINGFPVGDKVRTTTALDYRIAHDFSPRLPFDRNTVDLYSTISLQGTTIDLQPRRSEITVMMWLEKE